MFNISSGYLYDIAYIKNFSGMKLYV